MDSNVQLVRHAAASLLNEVSKRHYTFLQNTYFLEIHYEKILYVIQNGGPEEVAHLCCFIENIAKIEGSNEELIKNCIIKKHTMKTMEVLIGAAHNPRLTIQDFKVVDVVFTAIFQIITVYVGSQSQLDKLQAFYNIIIENKNGLKKEHHQAIQRCCYSNITCILGTLTKGDFNYKLKYSLEDRKKHFDIIFRPLTERTISEIKNDATLNEDAVTTIGYLAKLLKKDFTAYFADIFPYISIKLEEQDDSNYELTKACFMTTCEFIAEDFLTNEEVENFVKIILSNLNNPAVNPELKPGLMLNLSQVLLHKIEILNIFMEDINSLYYFAYECIVNTINSETYSNNFEFINYFKESVVESLTYIVWMIAEDHPKNTLKPKVITKFVQEHFGKFREFVIKTCSQEAYPNVEYIRDCIFCITDFTRLWPIESATAWKAINDMMVLLKVPVFDQILQTLQLYEHKVKDVTKGLDY